MNKSNIIAFIIGGGVGAATTYFVMKDRFAAQRDEEIASYERERSRVDASQKADMDTGDMASPIKIAEVRTHSEGPSVSDAQQITRDLHYANYFDKGDEDEDEEDPEAAMPDPGTDIKQITYGEYGTNDRYETAEVYYYANGVVTDENDEPIENWENIIGTEFIENWEDDQSAYVRNEKLNTDYEIIKQEANYEPQE